ncbi:MAG: AlpA family phage regulatory protein [Alphaproteobacteria bacterium]|nr:AlpA family phage regulatory protein [Alphaproteobacteria bacterium]
MPNFLRLDAVKKLTGLGRSTIYELMEIGGFPQRIQLSKRCVAWVEEEIKIWMEERIARRDAYAQTTKRS